jgi:hypothetical protein
MLKKGKSAVRTTKCKLGLEKQMYGHKYLGSGKVHWEAPPKMVKSYRFLFCCNHPKIIRVSREQNPEVGHL